MRAGCPDPIIAGYRSLPDSHHARKLYFQRAFIHRSTPYFRPRTAQRMGSTSDYLCRTVTLDCACCQSSLVHVSHAYRSDFFALVLSALQAIDHSYL